MTDTWWFNLIVTLLIIAASGFFVVIEFSLMGSRRNRLEENAESSRTARAGLRSLNELTIMLAGAPAGGGGGRLPLQMSAGRVEVHAYTCMKHRLIGLHCTWHFRSSNCALRSRFVWKLN